MKLRDVNEAVDYGASLGRDRHMMVPALRTGDSEGSIIVYPKADRYARGDVELIVVIA